MLVLLELVRARPVALKSTASINDTIMYFGTLFSDD
jgi:hypothetical protein